VSFKPSTVARFSRPLSSAGPWIPRGQEGAMSFTSIRHLTPHGVVASSTLFNSQR
jgi:hypothetical protein